MHNMCKIWFTNNIFSLRKCWYIINGLSKMLFFSLLTFPFTQISNDCCQKSYNGLWGCLAIPTVLQIFLIYSFLKMKRPFSFLFFNLHGYAFWFFIFLNERNMATFLLMIYLQWTVVHYTNLNQSCKIKPFLNYRSLNTLFCFFRFLI